MSTQRKTQNYRTTRKAQKKFFTLDTTSFTTYTPKDLIIRLLRFVGLMETLQGFGTESSGTRIPTTRVAIPDATTPGPSLSGSLVVTPSFRQRQKRVSLTVPSPEIGSLLQFLFSNKYCEQFCNFVRKISPNSVIHIPNVVTSKRYPLSLTRFETYVLFCS